MKNNICPYCSNKIDKIARDHFYPKCLGGGGTKNSNIIICCHQCNIKKAKHLFWSTRSVRDFISSGETYNIWLKKRIRTIKKDRLFLLSVALGEMT